MEKTPQVLTEIGFERVRQDERWGEQNHPDGTGLPIYQHSANRYRDHAERAAEAGVLAWRDVLQEEVYEALAESDPAKLRAELVQVAAVAVAWIEAIDRRQDAAARRTVGHATVLETTNAYEAQRLCGKDRGVSGLYYRPFARAAGHEEEYCRSADGGQLFLAAPPMDPVHILGIDADDEPAAGACPPGCVACATDESHDPAPAGEARQDGEA